MERVKKQDKQKQANAKHVQKKYQNALYHVGDEVLLYYMRKWGRKKGRLEPDFSGPYMIHSMQGKLVTRSNSKGAILKKQTNSLWIISSHLGGKLLRFHSLENHTRIRPPPVAHIPLKMIQKEHVKMCPSHWGLQSFILATSKHVSVQKCGCPTHQVIMEVKAKSIPGLTVMPLFNIYLLLHYFVYLFRIYSATF